MSITHEDTTRNAFCSSVNTNLGSGANCVLKAAGAVVSTIPLNDPAFDAPSAGVMALDVVPVPEDSSAVGNASSVDSMEFQNSGATAIFTGDNITGIAGGGDLELSKNPIDAGDTVQLTSFSYTASP